VTPSDFLDKQYRNWDISFRFIFLWSTIGKKILNAVILKEMARKLHWKVTHGKTESASFDRISGGLLRRGIHFRLDHAT
jgi:hypothetical protein